MLSWQQLVSALFIGNLFVVCNDDNNEDFYAKETQHVIMTEVSNRGLLSKQETTDFFTSGTMRGTVDWLREWSRSQGCSCNPGDGLLSC